MLNEMDIIMCGYMLSIISTHILPPRLCGGGAITHAIAIRHITNAAAEALGISAVQDTVYDVIWHMRCERLQCLFINLCSKLLEICNH